MVLFRAKTPLKIGNYWLLKLDCLVEGCKTKHCLRLVDGERIYSEFCSAHSCRHFWPEFCACPTYPWDKYCSCHARN